MSVVYQHLRPEQVLPPVGASSPFKVVIVSEASVDRLWLDSVADWLVKGGCLYAMSWGDDCALWEDSIDHACLKQFDYGEAPDDAFIMTTCHSNESLTETFWFAGHTAHHATVELERTLILHVANRPRPSLLEDFDAAQLELPE